MIRENYIFIMRYILFDLDGTLTDPKEGITKCVQYALKKFGIDADCDDLVPFIGPPLITSFREFYGLDPKQCEQAVVYYRERFSTVGLFENVPYNGIDNMLEKLKQKGCILAIATSKPTVFTMRICDKFGLTEYFDLIKGSELDGTNAEKADVIRCVLEELGAAPEDTVMIGDRKFDILGAKEFGLKSVGVSYGYASEGELEAAGADYIVDTVEELAGLLSA